MAQIEEYYYVTRVTIFLLLCTCAVAYPNRPIRNRDSDKVLARLLDALRKELHLTPTKHVDDSSFVVSDASYPAVSNPIAQESSSGIFDSFPQQQEQQQQQRNTQLSRLLSRTGNSLLARNDHSILSRNDNSLLKSSTDNSVVEKRQGAWDYDYGLGGGRFGKRGYYDYNLGGGRFGRDVDHVTDLDDDVDFED